MLNKTLNSLLNPTVSSTASDLELPDTNICNHTNCTKYMCLANEAGEMRGGKWCLWTLTTDTVITSSINVIAVWSCYNIVNQKANIDNPQLAHEIIFWEFMELRVWYKCFIQYHNYMWNVLAHGTSWFLNPTALISISLKTTWLKAKFLC